MKEGLDGYLYIVSYRDGNIYRIVPKASVIASRTRFVVAIEYLRFIKLRTECPLNFILLNFSIFR